MLGELKHGRFIWRWVEVGYVDGRPYPNAPSAWKLPR